MHVKEAVLEDGTVKKFRTLSFVFCESKQKGSACYPDKVFAKEDTPLHENIFLFILLLLEYRGLVKSALDVYNGDKKLVLNKNKCKSPELLLECLQDGHVCYSRAISTLIIENHHATHLNADLDNVNEQDVEYLRNNPTANYDVFVHQLRLAHGKQCLFSSSNIIVCAIFWKTSLPLSSSETVRMWCA